MKVMVLGGTGMLGHKLCQVFAGRFDTYLTIRQSAASVAPLGLFDSSHVKGQVSAQDFDSVTRAVAAVRPEAVVNCIGIVKQHALAHDPIASIGINSLFPQRLGQLCQAAGIRLVHISTDCVFSGRAGNYTEADVSDAEDLYGRTKFLGEVAEPGCLTLRTSIIGRELSGTSGLVEWFVSRQGKTVNGYARAIYTGFTTQALAEIIADILEKHPDISGLWHVSSEPISKYELLGLINASLKLGITIDQDEAFACDRSLNSDRFRDATGYHPPTWVDMVTQLAEDRTLYEELRRIHVSR